MSGPRYSIIPADALADVRITDLHLRVLALLGSHSDSNGWLTANQKTLAARARKTRETINRAIADLVAFGYVRKRARVGDDGRRLVNRYQVITDRELVEEATESDPHVLPASQGVCDPHVTGGVISGDHRGCDLKRSQQENDLFSERPSSNEDKRASPVGELAKVLDAERARAVVEHRKAIGKRLTPYAAKLMAAQFAKVADPNAAAEAMIANGWQGFRPEWLESRRLLPAAAPAPPANGRPRTVAAAAKMQLQQLQSEGSNHAIEQR